MLTTYKHLLITLMSQLLASFDEGYGILFQGKHPTLIIQLTILNEYKPKCLSSTIIQAETSLPLEHIFLYCLFICNFTSV